MIVQILIIIYFLSGREVQSESRIQQSKMVKFCCCVPLDSIHIIAGTNGDILEKMSFESQTLMTLQSSEDAQSGSNERIITIEGARECIVDALKVLLPILIDRKNIESDSIFSSIDSEGVQIMKWLIPQQPCGALIGKGGEGIKNIEKLSGAYIRVLHVHEYMDNPEERFALILL